MVKLCDELAKDKGSWAHDSRKPRELNAWVKASSQSWMHTLKMYKWDTWCRLDERMVCVSRQGWAYGKAKE